MRLLFTAAIAFLCLSLPAQGAPVDQFTGDRYRMAYGGGYARDVAKAVKKQRAVKPKKAKKKVRKPVYAQPLTLAKGFRRELRRAAERLRSEGRSAPITFWVRHA